MRPFLASTLLALAACGATAEPLFVPVVVSADPGIVGDLRLVVDRAWIDHRGVPSRARYGADLVVPAAAGSIVVHADVDGDGVFSEALEPASTCTRDGNLWRCHVSSARAVIRHVAAQDGSVSTEVYVRGDAWEVALCDAGGACTQADPEHRGLYRMYRSCNANAEVRFVRAAPPTTVAVRLSSPDLPRVARIVPSRRGTSTAWTIDVEGTITRARAWLGAIDERRRDLPVERASTRSGARSGLRIPAMDTACPDDPCSLWLQVARLEPVLREQGLDVDRSVEVFGPLALDGRSRNHGCP